MALTAIDFNEVVSETLELLGFELIYSSKQYDNE